MEPIKEFFQGKKTYIVGITGVLTVWFGYVTGYDFTGADVTVSFSGAISATVVIVTQIFQKVGANRIEKKVDAIVTTTGA